MKQVGHTMSHLIFTVLFAYFYLASGLVSACVKVTSAVSPPKGSGNSDLVLTTSNNLLLIVDSSKNVIQKPLKIESVNAAFFEDLSSCSDNVTNHGTRSIIFITHSNSMYRLDVDSIKVDSFDIEPENNYSLLKNENKSIDAAVYFPDNSTHSIYMFFHKNLYAIVQMDSCPNLLIPTSLNWQELSKLNSKIEGPIEVAYYKEGYVYLGNYESNTFYRFSTKNQKIGDEFTVEVVLTPLSGVFNCSQPTISGTTEESNKTLNYDSMQTDLATLQDMSIITFGLTLLFSLYFVQLFF